ncbi:MAG: type II toxin-antitoxin system YafQ family toxin [Patescibacteria group bacterium]
MYLVRSTKGYRKAYKQVSKQKGFDADLLGEIIDTLARGEKLDQKYKDHQLTGEMKDSRECHIKHNLLLVYEKNDDILVLLLLDIGTHDDVLH